LRVPCRLDTQIILSQIGARVGVWYTEPRSKRLIPERALNTLRGEPKNRVVLALAKAALSRLLSETGAFGDGLRGNLRRLLVIGDRTVVDVGAVLLDSEPERLDFSALNADETGGQALPVTFVCQ